MPNESRLILLRSLSVHNVGIGLYLSVASAAPHIKRTVSPMVFSKSHRDPLPGVSLHANAYPSRDVLTEIKYIYIRLYFDAGDRGDRTDFLIRGRQLSHQLPDRRTNQAGRVPRRIIEAVSRPTRLFKPSIIDLSIEDVIEHDRPEAAFPTIVGPNAVHCTILIRDDQLQNQLGSAIPHVSFNGSLRLVVEPVPQHDANRIFSLPKMAGQGMLNIMDPFGSLIIERIQQTFDMPVVIIRPIGDKDMLPYRIAIQMKLKIAKAGYSQNSVLHRLLNWKSFSK
ncbi:hypothetical protein D3C76_701500 [compost metagenome]